MLNFRDSPLGQLQDSWSCAPAAHTEHWDPDSDLNSLLPICAVSSPSTKIAEPDSWAQVKTRNHGHGKSSQLESQTDSRSKTNQFTGCRFAVLADDTDKSFPVFRQLQKSAVRKKTREQKSLLIAPVNEGVNDPEFTRRADELRQVCWAERVKVKADTRFGQRQILCHDRPINALLLKQVKTDAKEWQVLSLAVDSRAAESVTPHLLINEHPIRETEASSSGLNYMSGIGDPIPNLGEQRLPLITREGSTRSMTLQAAPVDRPLCSVKRMCQAGHRVVFDSDGSYV